MHGFLKNQKKKQKAWNKKRKYQDAKNITN